MAERQEFDSDTPMELSQFALVTTELVCLGDVEGKFRWLNDRWTEVLGWSKSELKSRSFLEFVHPDDLDQTLSEMDKLREGITTLRFENRYRCRDGSFRHLAWSSVPTSNGILVAVARDVTKEREDNIAAETRLRQLQLAEDLAEVGHWRVSIDDEEMFWSPKVYAIHGVCHDTFTPTVSSIVELYHPEDRETVRTAFSTALKDGRPFEFERRVALPDGSERNVLSRGILEVSGSGDATAVFGVFQDVTELKKRETELIRLNKHLNDRVTETEELRRDLGLFSEIVDLMQCSESEEEVSRVLGMMLPKIFRGIDGAVYIVEEGARSAQCVTQWGNTRQAEAMDFGDCWALRRGKAHHYTAPAGLACRHHVDPPTGECNCALLTAHGESVGVVVLRAESAQQQANLKAKDLFVSAVADQLQLAIMNVRLRLRLKRNAIQDPLTGLYNRRHMQDELIRALGIADRHNLHVAIVMIDVDDFKQVNDEFGHAIADEWLEKFGFALRDTWRRDDFACRYGGDEFLVAFAGADAEKAKANIARLRERCAEIRVPGLGKSVGRITFSAGISVYPDCGTTIGELIRSADAAMYRAKRSGRNRTEVSLSDQSVAVLAALPDNSRK